MSDGVDRLVAVMDRLRSPGGCPWDAEQTHQSLIPYAIEEVFEFAEAVEAGDRDHLMEELGDVLLQVVFHARLGQEHAQQPFDLDLIAHRCADKLVERHPHVFADENPQDMAALHRQWEAIKARTHPRASVADGIPAGMGALARAQKLIGRATRSGVWLGDDAHASAAGASPSAAEAFGTALLRLVREADAAGVDAEQALRAATRDYEAQVRAKEAQHRP